MPERHRQCQANEAQYGDRPEAAGETVRAGALARWIPLCSANGIVRLAHVGAQQVGDHAGKKLKNRVDGRKTRQAVQLGCQVGHHCPVTAKE